MILFFDTSALIKFFHEEEGTEVVTGLIHNEENEIWISEATGVEFLSALYRIGNHHIGIRRAIYVIQYRTHW
jgi:uncharacterized protein with PIN domain